MPNHQARSVVPALPNIAARLDPAPFSAAVLKRLRDQARAAYPSNSTLDKVARYNPVQFTSAVEIVAFVNKSLTTGDQLDVSTAVANFDCRIEGIGSAVSYLEYRNGQHLELMSVVSVAMGLDTDTVDQIFRGKVLFPEAICKLCVNAMTSHFDIQHLRIVRMDVTDHSYETPRGGVIRNCLKLLI